MINIEQIKKYFPPALQNNSIYYKYMLKEYLQLLILDFLSSTSYIKKIVFIGGTYLRLVMGIDRFSEDIDFDCKDLTKDEFHELCNDVANHLRKNGYKVELKKDENENLKAFREGIYFPEFLFQIGFSAHRDAKFLIKIEAQDQGVDYNVNIDFIKGCGFFFPFSMPPVSTICSMKIAALINRQKGRDFYDVLFLLSLAEPDYSFLSAKCGIHNPVELKGQLNDILLKIDMNSKIKDFQHLLFNSENGKKILYFNNFIDKIN